MWLQLVQDESGTGRTNSLFTGSQSQMCHSHASYSCCVSKGSPFKREKDTGSATNTKLSHYGSDFSHKVT